MRQAPHTESTAAPTTSLAACTACVRRGVETRSIFAIRAARLEFSARLSWSLPPTIPTTVVVKVGAGALLRSSAWLPHSVDADRGDKDPTRVRSNVMFSCHAAALSKPL